MPKLKFLPHCTEYPPQYWCYPPTVLILSPRMYWCYPPNVLNTLHSTEAIPPLYWCYPPLYWCYPPTVLMLSPHCTEQPPQYWRYPPTVLKLSPHMYCCYPPTVLKVSLHSTEYPPQYWCYPPACTDVIPPLYWSYPPTVLKLSPHCTEQPPQYWSYPPTVLMLSPRCTEQPPMYWTTSTVLNRRYVGWFRFRFDLASLRLSPERTSLFLSPKFREMNFKKVQLCMIFIEDICKPKCHHWKGRNIRCFQGSCPFLVDNLRSNFVTLWISLTSQPPNPNDGCQAPLLKIPQALLLKILQVPPLKYHQQVLYLQS